MSVRRFALTFVLLLLAVALPVGILGLPRATSYETRRLEAIVGPSGRGGSLLQHEELDDIRRPYTIGAWVVGGSCLTASATLVYASLRRGKAAPAASGRPAATGAATTA